ncbi:unnamed protein product [Angiostrongylus costaricensis]|uniref:Golgin-45 n=1 Tax=Angiostrongylus costaricensis TaxID=334426 RepID=A0A0R3PNY0_ANGCS|nr:unnamed protein product [Angiostrongylus costaricensis]
MELANAHLAHESHVLSLCNGIELQKSCDDDKRSAKETSKMKKPRFIPWEPFKAAPSADREGKAPAELPQLIPYGTEMAGVTRDSNNKAVLIDARRNQVKQNEHAASEKEIALEKQLTELKFELDMERKLSAELKRLMIATISDDLQGQVEALTEDKISLASRVEKYSEKLIFESEQIEQLQIDRDVWRCKFLAQSIRTDELTFRMEVLIGISATSITNTEAQYFANLDLHKFLTRSPCEKRIRRKGPSYSNFTISCCPKCSGREIHLL